MVIENPDELFDNKPITDDEKNLFEEEPKDEAVGEVAGEEKPGERWKILVVDDEEDIHSVTRMALKGFTYQGKEIEFLDAYSGKESHEILRNNPDIAVILLDVVMETNTAGLELVKYIRDKLGNKFAQIVLRTGYPGYAPEREIIVSYDINDYKTKTELTSFKLFTLVLASLRAYSSVTELEGLRLNLENKVKERTAQLEQKNLQIMEMDQLKTRFFNNISHEFRTPLTLILGPLENMISDEEMEDQERRKVERMHRNALRLLGLINQLMDLSKFDAGNMKLELTEGNPVHELKTLITGFAPLAERKQVKFKYKLPEKPLRTYYDIDKLEKIITNLLSNAFRFTPEDGLVNCQVVFKEKSGKMKSSELEVSVSDTGRGIPPEQFEKIFDRFYQVEEQKEGGGTGIGLSLTRELVVLHHGNIKVESEPGKGSCFTVTIPVGKSHLKENEYVILKEEKKRINLPLPELIEIEERYSPEETGQSLPEEKPILLVAEDNSDVRAHIFENLQEEFRIIEAADGEQGLEKSLDSIPDLVITDLMMPKMDGVEMCNRLKTDERTSHIPVIMLTAKANGESKIEGLETGADDYVIKPFNIKELIARVKNLIGQRKKLRERFSREVTLEPKDIAITSVDEKFLNRAIGIIEDHMGDFEFDAATFQDEIGMSRSQLFRKLRALVDQSATEFIRTIRLKRAARLLEQGYGNVAEVTYEVGFNNLSYFARCFKKLYSVSPSEYLRSTKDSGIVSSES